jgi:hypothetical protein
MAPSTVEKIRQRASDLLRGSQDSWRATLLADNGLALGRAADAAGGAECPPSKVFLDVLDGRITWTSRENVERHAAACWHCIDHFCRMAESVELSRKVTPLPEAEIAPFFALLGVARQAPGRGRQSG